MDVPSTPRSRVKSDSGVSRTRGVLKASDPGSLLSPSSTSSTLPLTTPSGEQHSRRGHRRTVSDAGKATSKGSTRNSEPTTREGSLPPNSRLGLNLNPPPTPLQKYVTADDAPGLTNESTTVPSPTTPKIVIRQATKNSEQLEDSHSIAPSVVNNELASGSVAEHETPTVPSLIFSDLSEEPDSGVRTPEESASIVTPKDSTAFPAVQLYESSNGPININTSSASDKPRPRTISETCPPVSGQKGLPSIEQRPGSCPPVAVTDPLSNKRNNPGDATLPTADLTTVRTTSEFFTAPVALEEALMKGIDVSSDPEHPESIAKMEEEAVSYLEEGQFERATNLLIEVLKLRYRIQGENHLFTIQTMSNLGLGYEGQGKLDQAIQVLQMTLGYLKRSHSAINLRFRTSIKERLAELIKRHEEAQKMMTVVRSNLKRGPKRGNSVDQIATRVRFDEDLPLHIDINTTPEAIMAHLTNRRCPNLTEYINTLRCGKSPINRGGFGDIWKGELTDGRPVAMKRIYEGERKLNKRLAQELYAWSKANHQNVLELLGLAYYRDYLVMISPWMKYGSIHEYLGQHPESNRLHLAIQIADGIAHLHRIGMVHGDLKAQNIFVSHEGVLKVGDFGLAVMLGERSVAFQASTTGNGPQGTIRWMAPELFDPSGRFNISMESDIYSLAMLIHYSPRKLCLAASLFGK
ncbi:Cysteine-rich receptor-like protein kinase 7 Short=Cysteine-rich RLK7 [Rhizoctonia solani AG-1 IB]|uniref:Cysteine-rich receptor-like protein kinase 7 Short=Cysteine-rich RLK7 n=1 Tax=Thanatephorus cucumeris (strain AG1-IB / isolate 7/3/14) TaxID=1108050 RepID=M5CG98_THACB|nr:Cysteine-rich receptor-like protein kinase 7 Short=Cysteine-rich RLK7 [Rhizoctonia solani AG-1 IB]